MKCQDNILKTSRLDTVLGPVVIITDQTALYFLAFAESKCLEKATQQLTIKTQSIIIPGKTPLIELIKDELTDYFAGKLKTFKTPIHIIGSVFQKKAWQELIHIPYGETRSYLEQAKEIGKPTAFRAVANANAANNISIIIPCHRIIRNNRTLGGYRGGSSRKQYLLNLEQDNQ